VDPLNSRGRDAVPFGRDEVIHRLVCCRLAACEKVAHVVTDARYAEQAGLFIGPCRPAVSLKVLKRDRMEPGSGAHGRAPILQRPSTAVKPKPLSTLFPPRNAQTLAPLPRWATITRPSAF